MQGLWYFWGSYGTSGYVEYSTSQREGQVKKEKREYKCNNFKSRLNLYIVPWCASHWINTKKLQLVIRKQTLECWTDGENRKEKKLSSMIRQTKHMTIFFSLIFLLIKTCPFTLFYFEDSGWSLETRIVFSKVFCSLFNKKYKANSKLAWANNCLCSN